MEPQKLSSNWKKLQQTLQPKPKTPAATVLGKRKAEATGPPSTKKARATPSAHSEKVLAIQSRAGATRRGNQSAGRTTGTSTSAPSNARRKSMGNLYSKPDAGENPVVDDAIDTALASAPGVAAEDIPASQLRLARAPSGGSLRSFSDTINSGTVASVSVGKYVAIDCEMVGVGPNPERSSMLARVSMVNFHGEQVYDSFVAPKEAVTDYRTFVSGITEALIRDARTFERVQADVARLLEGRILVGHAVRHDLEVLMLGHPKRDIRDTSRHKVYRELANGRTPGLKRLAKEILGVEIQAGAHSSIEDARATMMLYKREKNNFEKEHVKKFGVDRRHIRPEAIEGEVVAVKRGGEGGGKARSNNKKKGKRK